MRSDSTLARWLRQVRQSLGSSTTLARGNARRERAVRRLRAHDQAAEPWLAEERLLLSAPAVVLSVTDATYTENSPPVTLDPAITANDPDADFITGAQIKITDYEMGQDQLSFNPQFGITGSFDNNTGILTLNGTATASQYATVLSSIQYQNLSENPTDLTRTIEYTITDTEPSDSAPVTLTLNLVSVADTPADVNATVDEDTLSAPIVLTPNPVDGASVTHFQITEISNGTLYQADGVTEINEGDFITLADATAGVKFQGDSNYFGAAGFKFQAATGDMPADLGGAKATAAITVDPVADTPANVSASVNEDTLSAPIVLNPNPVDNGSVTHYRITGITNGTLYQADGVTQIQNGDFITAADAAAGVKFQGNTNYFGPASFQFQAATGGMIADLGGGPATANITVNSVNDNPTITGPGPQTTDEGTVLTLNGITINDVDAASNILTVEIQATGPAAAYTLGSTSGITFVQGNNGGTTPLIIQGTLSDLQMALNGLQVQPQDNGTLNLTLIVTDEANGTNQVPIPITVNNVAPTLTLTGPAPNTVNEGDFITVTGSATDPANTPTTLSDNDPLTYTWSVTKDGNAYANGTGNVANFQAVDNGSYVVTMTVNDGDLGSDTETYTIDVANVPPVLTLTGPAAANEGDFVTVTASTFDPANPPTTPSENDPQTYTWSVTKDGNAYASGTGNVANFQVVDNGVYVVTMTVNDGDLGSDTETHTINVANMPPTLTLMGPVVANEGDFVTVTGTTTDPANPPTTPSENDPLTYTWSVTKDGNAYANGVGNVANFQVVDNGVYVVTMTVNDGDMGSDTEMHTINVANIPPTLTLTGPAPNSVNEGDFVTVTGSATDPANQPTTPTDNDPLTYTWSVTKDGNAYASGVGNVANFQAVDNGVYVVTMTVNDDDLGSDTETYTINVANVAPTLTLTGPAPNTLNEGDFVTVTGSATDPANQPTTPTDNDPLTYSWSVTKDGNAYANGVGNVANFQVVDNGAYVVTMTVTDGDLGSDTETYTINVANVAPTLTLTGPAPNTVNEGDFVTVTGSATDPANQPTTPTDNDPLTYTWSVTKDGNAYASGTGNVANFQVVDNGLYVVTMTVNDGDLGSDTETYTIDIANVAPVLTLTGPVAANEGDLVTVTGSTFDPANPPTTPSINDPLTYTWSVTKDGNAYASGTGNVANFQVVDNGVYVVTMTVNDGDMGSDTETHTINVANVPPTLTLTGPATANEGDFVTVTGSATDPANPPTTPSENDPLTYTWSVTKDGNAYASGVGNVANFQVVDNGVYVVTMTVTDGDLGSDTETHTINVANVAPTLTLTGPAPNSVNEGDFVTVTGSATDPANQPTTPTDNDPLTYTWSVTKDGNAYASGVGNVANFQVVDNGVYVVTMTVNDGDLGSDTETYTINVANVAPTLTLTGPAPNTVNEGDFVTVTGSATDPANPPTTPSINDPLTYTWSVTKNGNAYASGTGNVANFQVNDNAVYVVTMTVNDGDLGSDTETYTINVANVPPTLTLTGPPTANEGDTVTVTGSATDPANPPTTPGINDPLTYTWSVTKDGNAYASGTGNVANFQVVDNGVYVVTMTVSDGDGGSDTETHTINVANVDPALTLTGPATADEGAFVTVTGSTFDPANPPTTPSINDPLTYTWSVTKDGNAYTSGTGNVANFQVVDNGVYVVTMTVNDGDGGSDTETHTINVANVNPTLTLTGPAPNTVNEGDFVTVTGSATDPANPPTTPSENDPHTYVWSVTKDGNAYANGVGNVANFQVVDNGVYVVTMTVTDDDLGSDAETYTINVANVAPTPTITGDTTGFEGTAINLVASSTDPANQPTTPTDNDSVTYTWSVTKDGNPYASGSGTNFTLTPNNEGTYVVTMTAADDDGGVQSTTHTIVVANVAPVATINATDIDGQFYTYVDVSVADPGNDNITVQIVWGDINPDDYLSDPFVNGETATDRVFPTVTHRYLNAPNPQDPLADVQVNFIIKDGTDTVIETIFLKVTGQGIPAGGVYVTPEPEKIVIPQQQVVVAPPAILTQPNQQQVRNEEIVSREDTQTDEEARLVLHVVGPTGVEGPAVTLPDGLLKNLRSLFAKLPDGHYRVYLVQGESRRLVIEVFVRQGRAIDPAEADQGTQERPPQSQPALDRVMQADPAAPSGTEGHQLGQTESEEAGVLVSIKSNDADATTSWSAEIEPAVAARLVQPEVQNEPETVENAEESGLASVALAGVVAGETWRRAARRQRAAAGTTGPDNGEKIEKTWSRLARRARQWKPR